MPILQPATNAIVACLRLVLPSFHHQRYRASLFLFIFLSCNHHSVHTRKVVCEQYQEMVKQRASKFWGLLYSSFYLLHSLAHSLLYHDKASRIAIVVFWCFVFCTPHQNTRVHYYYCCWKVFHSLLDAATIPATARAFFFVSVCSMYAFFIIIIRCYRTFLLAHTHPEKWRDDFSFGLLFFFLFCSSSLFFFSSTVAIVHNWLYFTPYDISRSSVLCIFHVEYWTLNRWKCAESVATCCGNRIEHSVRESIRSNTCLEIQFTFFSFRRFLDIYFHLSYNELEHLPVIDAKSFKTIPKNFHRICCVLML